MSYLSNDLRQQEARAAIVESAQHKRIVILDTHYTGYLITALKKFVSFSLFASDPATDRVYAIYDKPEKPKTSKTPNNSDFNKFINTLRATDIICPNQLHTKSRAHSLHSVVSHEMSQTRGNVTFVILSNNTLLRSMTGALKRSFPGSYFVFCEHSETLALATNKQHKRFILLDTNVLFPDYIKDK